jgi:hypothetical protein
VEASDRLLEFRRTMDGPATTAILSLTVTGRARLRTPKGTRQFELGPGTLEQLRRELGTAGLAELPEELRRPPDAHQPQPDVVEYAGTAGGHTVHALAARSRPSWCRWSRRCMWSCSGSPRAPADHWSCPASNPAAALTASPSQ